LPKGISKRKLLATLPKIRARTKLSLTLQKKSWKE